MISYILVFYVPAEAIFVNRKIDRVIWCTDNGNLCRFRRVLPTNNILTDQAETNRNSHRSKPAKSAHEIKSEPGKFRLDFIGPKRRTCQLFARFLENSENSLQRILIKWFFYFYFSARIPKFGKSEKKKKKRHSGWRRIRKFSRPVNLPTAGAKYHILPVPVTPPPCIL